jgi:uncharacterized membrane protein
MIAEISACIAAVQGINSAINTLKEARSNAGDLSGVIGKWADATQLYQDAERKGAGKLSYKEALKMESIERQLKNFDRQFYDICLLQQQGDLYHSVKKRMADAELAHKKEVAKLRIKRRAQVKFIKFIATIAFWLIFGMGAMFGSLYLFIEFR